MLIVIAIMSILLTVGAVGIGGITSGKSVASAVSSTEALFEEARSIAVSKGTDAYVLVCVDDPSNANTYLRRIVVAYLELNPDGTKSDKFALRARALRSLIRPISVSPTASAIRKRDPGSFLKSSSRREIP